MSPNLEDVFSRVECDRLVILIKVAQKIIYDLEDPSGVVNQALEYKRRNLHRMILELEIRSVGFCNYLTSVVGGPINKECLNFFTEENKEYLELLKMQDMCGEINSRAAKKEEELRLEFEAIGNEITSVSWDIIKIRDAEVQRQANDKRLGEGGLEYTQNMKKFLLAIRSCSDYAQRYNASRLDRSTFRIYLDVVECGYLDSETKIVTKKGEAFLFMNILERISGLDFHLGNEIKKMIFLLLFFDFNHSSIASI
jgi:hypothetical protein